MVLGDPPRVASSDELHQGPFSEATRGGSGVNRDFPEHTGWIRWIGFGEGSGRAQGHLAISTSDGCAGVMDSTADNSRMNADEEERCGLSVAPALLNPMGGEEAR